jgi:probable rRNA maturation factor
MMQLSFSVQYAGNEETLPARHTLRRWARAAQEHDIAVTLRFVGSREGRSLNAQFRGKPYPTNVLTFVYDDDAPRAGDIVLCAPVVRNEADEQGKTLAAHYAHLVVHGMLHLQGHDHVRTADAHAMENREREILARFGIDDPYAAERSKKRRHTRAPSQRAPAAAPQRRRST